MFDGLFEIVAKTLSLFYDLIPNYAFAIAMLTIVVMVVTTPFTLKGTRSMIQMQQLQPEVRRLQLKHKDDRQKLGEETMALYRDNEFNPMNSCLPMLLQAPIFMLLFQVIQGLTRGGGDGVPFNPKHLDESSAMYQALTHTDRMTAFGVDLAESASKALADGFAHGLPHVAMVAIVAVSSYYQQKQITGRNPNAEIPPQQKMIMRMMPAMFVFFAFVSPAALVVYFVTSNLYRIGMQHYITRTLYHGEDSLGAQAHKATLEAKQIKDEHGGPDLFPKIGRKAKAVEVAATETLPKAQATAGGVAKPPSPTARTGAQNRSKKRKKRR